MKNNSFMSCLSYILESFNMNMNNTDYILNLRFNISIYKKFVYVLIKYEIVEKYFDINYKNIKKFN